MAENEKCIDGIQVVPVTYEDLEETPYLTIGRFQPNGLPKIAGSLSDQEDIDLQAPVAVLH